MEKLELVVKDLPVIVEYEDYELRYTLVEVRGKQIYFNNFDDKFWSILKRKFDFHMNLKRKFDGLVDRFRECTCTIGDDVEVTVLYSLDSEDSAVVIENVFIGTAEVTKCLSGLTFFKLANQVEEKIEEEF